MKAINTKPHFFCILILAIGIFISYLPYNSEGSQEKNAYINLTIGPQWRSEAPDAAGSTTFKTGFAVNKAIGYYFQNFRVEGEISYLNNRCKTTDPAGDDIGLETSSGSVDVNTLMANVYYDLPIGFSKIKPYVSSGIGMYRVSIDGLTTPTLRNYGIVIYAKSNWTFAYQVRCGINAVLNPKIDFITGYRFLKGNKLDINLADGTLIKPDGKLNCIEAGFRFKF